MKQTISNKLLRSGVTVFLLILSIIFAGQVCIFILKKTSNKIVIEYNELEVVKDYELTLHKILTCLNSYSTDGNITEKANFLKLLKTANKNLEKCKVVITKRHDVDLLFQYDHEIAKIKMLGYQFFTLDYSDNKVELIQLKNHISEIINHGIKNLEELEKETNTEIEEYVLINHRAINHSVITIIALGLFILLVVSIGGFNLIKEITIPINKLIKATKLIREGNLNTTIAVKSDNEFKLLADNFNAMILDLMSTTVSRNYYDNILKSMIDPLIVTDKNGNIETMNMPAVFLLGYNKHELNGTNFEKLFYDHDSSDDQKMNIRSLNKQKSLTLDKFMLAKDKRMIPVQVSGSKIQNSINENEGYVIVAHDLTVQKHNEKLIQTSQKERLNAINEAQEKERLRIATDLHDGLGQILTAISYSLQNCLTEQKEPSKEMNDKLTDIQKQLDNAITESKNIARNLIPIVLNDFGLSVALKNLVNELNTKTKTKFNFNHFNFKERIDPKLEKTIYRICQEALNNIIKHAKAESVEIQLVKHPDIIVLVIEDDGQGFNYKKYKTQSSSRGIGLISMRERVKSFNGEFSLNSNKQGTEIIIELPYSNNHEKN